MVSTDLESIIADLPPYERSIAVREVESTDRPSSDDKFSWKMYVPWSVANAWPTLPIEAKLVAYVMADERTRF